MVHPDLDRAREAETEGGVMKLRRLIIPAWMSLMILLLACPGVQAYSGYFYVIPNSAPLRECASPGCEVLLTVYQGDKVQILERTPSGWSKVRLVDKPVGIGWIPSDWLSISPDRKTVALPTYHVNVSSVPLRQHPRPEAETLATLHLNDAVEMMGVGKSGWAQVRVLQSNLVGWVAPRYLSPGPPRGR
jgi:SH3-like domain-containing protein